MHLGKMGLKQTVAQPRWKGFWEDDSLQPSLTLSGFLLNGSVLWACPTGWQCFLSNDASRSKMEFKLLKMPVFFLSLSFIIYTLCKSVCNVLYFKYCLTFIITITGSCYWLKLRIMGQDMMHVIHMMPVQYNVLPLKLQLPWCIVRLSRSKQTKKKAFTHCPEMETEADSWISLGRVLEFWCHSWEGSLLSFHEFQSFSGCSILYQL